jgi:hypothetical protein
VSGVDLSCQTLPNAVAGVATAIYPPWFEALFDASPDAGSGVFEWAIAIALMLVAVMSSMLARRDLLRHRAALTDAA